MPLVSLSGRSCRRKSETSWGSHIFNARKQLFDYLQHLEFAYDRITFVVGEGLMHAALDGNVRTVSHSYSCMNGHYVSVDSSEMYIVYQGTE